MRVRPHVAAMALALATALGAPAAADDIEPPPPACPDGSRPESSHAGPTCEPLPDCTSDAECAAGERCFPLPQCIEARGCGGRREDPTCFVRHVLGNCATDAPRCPTGGECLERRVCLTAPVEPGRASASSPATRSGCAIVTAPRCGSVHAALVLALGLTLARRRAVRRQVR